MYQLSAGKDQGRQEIEGSLIGMKVSTRITPIHRISGNDNVRNSSKKGFSLNRSPTYLTE